MHSPLHGFLLPCNRRSAASGSPTAAAASSKAAKAAYAEPLLVGAEDVAAWHRAWGADYVQWRADTLLTGDPELQAELGLRSAVEEQEVEEEDVPEPEGAGVAALLLQQWIDARASA